MAAPADQADQLNTGSQNLVFTRILGHEDIEHSETWKDAGGCWICERCSKVRIEWQPEDEIIMRDNIERLDQLKKHVAGCLQVEGKMDKVKKTNEIQDNK